MKSLRKVLLAALAIGFVAACGGDSNTGPDDKIPGINTPGDLKFNYSGALSGNFSANGVPQFNPSKVDQSFAVAYHDADEGGIGVIAYHVKPGSRGDVVVMAIEGEKTGTYDMDYENCEANCATIMFSFDVDLNSTSNEGGRLFFTETGDIVVTALTSKELKGTFKGTALEIVFGGGPELNFTNGTFSIPLLEDIDSDPSLSPLVPALQSLVGADAQIEGLDRLPADRQARILEVMERFGIRS